MIRDGQDTQKSVSRYKIQDTIVSKIRILDTCIEDTAQPWLWYDSKWCIYFQYNVKNMNNPFTIFLLRLFTGLSSPCHTNMLPPFFPVFCDFLYIVGWVRLTVESFTPRVAARGRLIVQSLQYGTFFRVSGWMSLASHSSLRHNVLEIYR